MKNKFEKDWKKAAFKRIKMARPDLSDVTISSYIDSVYLNRLKNPECVVDNNYTGQQVKMTLIDIYNWLNDSKPIIGGYGVFFKNQNQIFNNVAHMIQKFLITRTKIKNRMKEELEKFGPDSQEYKQSDRLQGAEKVNANACYGAGGSKVSFLYNLYSAASVTATAQSLISTACAAFESFMADNTKFYDLDELINFIYKVIKEKTSIDINSVRPRTKLEVKRKLIKECKSKIDESKLDMILDNLTEEELTRLYYKNNLYKFTASCPEVIYRLRKIMSYTEKFRAPERKHMSLELESDLNIIWEYYEEFVLYNHPIYNRIFRLKTEVRKSVLVIDTDSNMILIRKWINMILDNFISEKKTEEHVYIAASIIGVFITKMITLVLNKYCKVANMPEEYWKNINMKNEFFFELLVTTDVKKNYIGKMLLREGKPMNGKIDIKGLSFVKSGISEEIGSYMKEIISSDITGKDKIDFRNIILKLNSLAENIKQTLLDGNPKYTKPLAVKSHEQYKAPMREMGIKAVLVYNFIYPGNPIELPDHVKIIKVKMTKLVNIEPLKETNPDIYDILVRNVFEADNELSKGITSLAIPADMEKIPDWIIPFIDIDQIVEDNIKSFFPVLKAIGLEIINVNSSKSTYSNIISI